MRLGALWSLAWRNVWRQRRRNMTLILAIGMGVGGLIVGNGLIRGMVADIENDAVALLTGHWKLLPTAFEDDPGVEHAFAPGAAVAGLDAAVEVRQWTMRLVVPGVVQSERQTRGVDLVGVDPADESKLSFVGDAAIEGRWLSGPDDAQVVLGTKLAAELETGVGRRIVVMTEHTSGISAEWGARIAGVYGAANAAANDGLVLTGRQALQQRLGATGVTEISVLGQLPEVPPPTMVAQAQAADSGLVMRDWKALRPIAAAYVSITGSTTLILSGVFVVAMAFGILNTLITAVLERTRELGLLQCLGMRPRWIVLQVLMESVVVIGGGLLLGFLVAAGGLWLIGDGIDLTAFAAGMEMLGGRPRLVPVVLPSDVGSVTAMVIVLGGLGTFFPARRAVRMNALEALTGRRAARV